MLRFMLLLLALLPWMCIVVATLELDDVSGADANAGEEVNHVSHVLVLDASNFTHVIKNHPFILVEFYAPWCGHCKQLAPEYEKAAAILQTNEPPIILAKVDASEEQNKGLATEFDVQGYPTLKIIRDRGAHIHGYKGPRDADGIVSYMKRQVGPPSEEIISAEQAQKLIEDKDIVIVGVFTSYDSEDFTNFVSIASKLRSDYDFKHTIDANLLPPVKDAITGPTIRVFKKFDEGFNDLKDFNNPEVVKHFLDEVSVPLVVYFNDDPVQRQYFAKIFMNPNCSKAFLFAEQGEEETRMMMKSAYMKLAEEHKGKGLRFIIAEGADSLKMLLQYLGVKNDTLPSIFIQHMNEKKYLLKKIQSSEEIALWFKDYYDGKLSEFYKSQPIPERNEEPVKVVVRDTLASMVLNSGKNVLLEFYAPWCGYCKSLAPILEEVAVEFESDPDVLIAKFDATENDIGKEKEFVVEGYPALYLHSASGKLTFYKGDRSKEDLVTFIRVHRDASENNTGGGMKHLDFKDEL